MITLILVESHTKNGIDTCKCRISLNSGIVWIKKSVLDYDNCSYPLFLD